VAPMSMTDRRRGLAKNALRPVQVDVGFHTMAEGSCLYQCGNTRVLCTASIEDTVPDWMKGKGKGWLTAEYQMHPRANPVRREKRDGRERPLGGRSREIQRLIGRGLRAALDVGKLGERTVVIDCDVLEADGGTRTAAVTGGFIALAHALHKITGEGRLTKKVIVDQVAAISVGHVDGELALDLCYEEDSKARVDLNLIGTARGEIVEIQGTAEGQAVPRADIDAMVDLGLRGISDLAALQRAALSKADIDLTALLIS
jgi:ribonuclease PH